MRLPDRPVVRERVARAWVIAGGLVLAGLVAPGCRADTLTAKQEAVTTGVGDPCVPAAESMASFNGFSEKEESVETMAPDCATSVCIVNHFRGRVSCPYGQDATGKPPSGSAACALPGTKNPVTGAGSSKALVAAQCVDRSPANTVYCSCRCANGDGLTNDGAAYCACPSGFACTPFVTPFGDSAAAKALAGSYCIKQGTAYDAMTACSATCDPQTTKCP